MRITVSIRDKGQGTRDKEDGNHMTPTGRTDHHEAITRIAMEYIEMPDLKLTALQARRLWNIPAEVCDRALAALVSCGFLAQTRTGAFLRRSSGSVAVALQQAS
jgi:hypothetical protein